MKSLVLCHIYITGVRETVSRVLLYPPYSGGELRPVRTLTKFVILCCLYYDVVHIKTFRRFSRLFKDGPRELCEGESTLVGYIFQVNRTLVTVPVRRIFTRSVVKVDSRVVGRSVHTPSNIQRPGHLGSVLTSG